MNQLSALDINGAIMTGVYTNIELEAMVNAIKFARASLAKRVARTLAVGTKVKWDSSKQGREVEGTITKIAKKYATVQANDSVLWQVPMNMLVPA